MEFAPIKPELRIESWRKRVPSRVERQDPFEGDGFDERPSTRLSPPRSSTRLSFLRSATPLFMRPSTPSSRPASSMTERPAGGKRKSLLGLFNLKRKRDSLETESVPRDPIRLKFLFVGSKAVGQTSLLYHARYGYFPDASPLPNPQWVLKADISQSSAFARPLYQTFDTSGVPDLNTVESLTYIAWDAVFLCFDISDKVSMYAIIQWWRHASNNGFAKYEGFQPLLYLVGLKKDANWHARRIGAHRYLECSAVTGEGMKEVFDDSAREAMRRALGGVEIQEEETAAPKKKRRFFQGRVF
ncbi:GTPase Rho [Fusarium albosuccineum]|uniref:GTPase Rho n=1 Tax=Fusarium albosuccineum TaxID=1237068 RepID=A0A8H4LNZ1_9HYPO|nr:GTPase Rho [Fusarium albosuccineum]